MKTRGAAQAGKALQRLRIRRLQKKRCGHASQGQRLQRVGGPGEVAGGAGEEGGVGLPRRVVVRGVQRAGLGLRNVDRLLLLVNAGLHAIVANAVTGRRSHRVIDGNDGQCADGQPLGLGFVEFRNLFFKRAAGQRDAERRLLERLRTATAGALLLQPLRTGILALFVTPDAVVGFIKGAGQIGAFVRQLEPGTLTQARRATELAPVTP